MLKNKYGIGSHLVRYEPVVSEPLSVLLHPVLEHTRTQPCRTILTSYNCDQETKEPFRTDGRTPVWLRRFWHSSTRGMTLLDATPLEQETHSSIALEDYE
jgi:hypothetical protein